MIDTLTELAPMGAVIVFAWGIYQFYRNTEVQFRRPYWERLLAVYSDACTNAAMLARTDVEADWKTARNNFWTLYFGPACLFEDLDVENAMVHFGDALDATPDFGSRDKDKLEDLALELAYACRKSLREDWSVPLEQLANRKSN